MTKQRWLACGVVAAVLAAPISAGTALAATALALSNRALTDAAAVIAAGRCVELRSAWEGRSLVTYATLALDEVFKGEAPGTITVTLPGGADANRRFPVAMTYAGAPQMVVGEEVFLFLDRDAGASGALTVVGFSQGKFSIVRDEDGGRSVSRNLTALTLRTAAGERRGAAMRKDLDEFKNEIRGYLAR